MWLPVQCLIKKLLTFFELSDLVIAEMLQETVRGFMEAFIVLCECPMSG